jgi:REP element-mobilizing transposase RayT
MLHHHLRRLEDVWIDQPIYFVNTCTLDRRPELASAAMHDICREVWRNCEQHYAGMVGRYVLMPDHLHFFCSPRGDAIPLSKFVAKWKEWTSKYAKKRHACVMPFWQQEFFDRLLRSDESYEAKSEYVILNPVRAGLVAKAEDWPFQGEMNLLQRG